MRSESEILDVRDKKYFQWNWWKKMADDEYKKHPFVRSKREIDKFNINADICFKKYLLLSWVLGDKDIEYKYYHESESG